MLSKRICTIRILDEVNCVFVGLHPDHIGYFYEEYSAFAPNYYFNPKFKLGSWDGKIRYFHKTGKTYVNLLNEIIPRVIGLGYKLKLDDCRHSIPVHPTPIDKDYLASKGVWDVERDCPWEMRDYQVDMVNALISNGGGVGIAGTGGGKAQPLDAKILTPSGWQTMGDMSVGSEVITPTGDVTTVVGVFPQGKKQTYKVTFHDGSSTRCEEDHLWQTKFPITDYTAKTESRVVDTKEIIRFLEKKKSDSHVPGNVSIPLIQDIGANTKQFTIHPYLLGVLLGDGCLARTPIISTADEQILENIKPYLEVFGITPKHVSNYDYSLSKDIPQNTFPPSPNLLTEELKNLRVWETKAHTKHIPEDYKWGSYEQRLCVIQGLLDTDGTVSTNGSISFSTSSKQLAEDFTYMVRSIGGTCNITAKTTQHLDNYVCIVGHPHPRSLFRLDRKRSRCQVEQAGGRIGLHKRIVSIEKDTIEETQCIMVKDSKHLYITDDFTVTHNTGMTAAIAHAYEEAGDLRSIIIVPDKNLTDQTVREYGIFKVDVGEYSGDRKDLKHKHIVSTWQSLKNNPTILHSFDVIIVDECHGLKGKVLSELLNEHGKNIPYRFGVTGTLPKEPADALAVKVAVGPVQFTIPAHKLIEQGYLAKLQIDIMQLETNFKKQYDEYVNETDDDPIATYNQFKDSYFPDWNAEKSYLATEKERLEWIASFIEAKRDTGKGNVLCLVNGVRFGKKLANEIENAVFLHGQDNMQDRKKVYDLFNEHNDLVVIATVNIASTGLNIKRIFNLMFIDVGKSFIRTIQTIGRGLRKAPDKDFVHVTDICSDLKYSKRHLRERMKFYKEAKYPYKKRIIDYTE